MRPCVHHCPLYHYTHKCPECHISHVQHLAPSHSAYHAWSVIEIATDRRIVQFLLRSFANFCFPLVLERTSFCLAANV